MPIYIDSQNGLDARAANANVGILANGAIPILPQFITTYYIFGVALALTLAVPTPADNGKILILWSEDASIHVITQGTVGFNGKGAAGTASVGGILPALGDSVTLVAHNGNWWAVGAVNTTIA